MNLNRRKKYLQIAFNRSLDEVEVMVSLLPPFDQIIVEAGTPFIKEYGSQGIASLVRWWNFRLGKPGYVVADLKCMDRGATEVTMVANAGASAATCLGLAPVETISEFVANCKTAGIDSMVDMVNVDFPFEILQKIYPLPDVVVLHRGVDEGDFGERMIPYHNIQRIKGAYDVMVSVAGGENLKEANRTFFNGADIAVVWRQFFDNPSDVNNLAQTFLSSIKGYAKRER